MIPICFSVDRPNLSEPKKVENLQNSGLKKSENLQQNEGLATGGVRSLYEVFEEQRKKRNNTKKKLKKT